MVQDIVTTVEDLRANILEKLDAVHALRAMLRKEYVPSTVCTHLEQCIKETEVSNMSFTLLLVLISNWMTSTPVF